MSDENPNPFTLIKHRGEPNRATFEGVTVTRQEKLFIQEWGGLVRCAPYDNHFIFEVPQTRKKMGMSEYLCTCGSAAIVAHPEDTKRRMFVCHFEALNGYHTTSIVNKDNFDQVAGETVKIPKVKRWLI